MIWSMTSFETAPLSATPHAMLRSPQDAYEVSGTALSVIDAGATTRDFGLPKRDRRQQIQVSASAARSGTHPHAWTRPDGLAGTARTGAAAGTAVSMATGRVTTKSTESQPSPRSASAPSGPAARREVEQLALPRWPSARSAPRPLGSGIMPRVSSTTTASRTPPMQSPGDENLRAGSVRPTLLGHPD